MITRKMIKALFLKLGDYKKITFTYGQEKMCHATPAFGLPPDLHECFHPGNLLPNGEECSCDADGKLGIHLGVLMLHRWCCSRVRAHSPFFDESEGALEEEPSLLCHCKDNVKVMMHPIDPDRGAP